VSRGLSSLLFFVAENQDDDVTVAGGICDERPLLSYRGSISLVVVFRLV